LSSGVSPTQATKRVCEPGMTISGPLCSVLSVSAMEAEMARGVGIPSSLCQVSKSECQ
jgi:hypothetical protein